MLLSRTASLVLLLTVAVRGQSFEVVSIKPQQFTGSGRVGVFVSGNRLTAEHIALADLVEFAYDMKDFQVSGGPAWVHSRLMDPERYLVEAKAEGDAIPSLALMRKMTQALLADRFQLKIRHEDRNLPAYNLIVNKGGPKLQPSAPDTKFSLATSSLKGNGLRIAAAHETLAHLVDAQLRLYAGKPVFDRTNLTGTYDFALEWTQDNPLAAGPDIQASDATGQTLFTALQEQLGLKLEPATAPFDTVVIESAAKPSGN